MNPNLPTNEPPGRPLRKTFTFRDFEGLPLRLALLADTCPTLPVDVRLPPVATKKGILQ